ncbi:MAG: hypothetical protein ABR543_14135 [Gemmatimonadaceae bacterium]
MVSGFAALVAVSSLLLLVNFDLVRRIPPLGDDYMLLQWESGDIFRRFMDEYGWGARPLGIALLDLLYTAARAMDDRVIWVVATVRTVSLVAIYSTVRLVFKSPFPIAVLVTILFALMPTSVEAWTMLNVAHQALSVGFVAVACGFYASLLWQERDPTLRVILIPLGAQIVAYLMYEQALLAIPAFVLVLALFRARSELAGRRQAVIVVVVSSVAAAMWLGVMLGSGYVAARTGPDTSAHAAQFSVFAGAAERLWMGFVQHHVWRVVEIGRGAATGWLKLTPGALVSAMALGLLIVATYRYLASFRLQKVVGSGPRLRVAGRVPLIVACLAASYAAMLPQALASPGVPLVSRMFYLPGFFLAFGIALSIGALASWRPLVAAVTAVLLIAWSGLAQRKYLSEMAAGAALTRAAAAVVADLPDTIRTGSVLVVAPDVFGTFSTPAVQSWGLRGVIQQTRSGQLPVGVLYFAASCDQALSPSGAIRDERNHLIGGVSFRAVVAYTGERFRIGRTVTEACFGAS